MSAPLEVAAGSLAENVCAASLQERICRPEVRNGVPLSPGITVAFLAHKVIFCAPRRSMVSLRAEPAWKFKRERASGGASLLVCGIAEGFRREHFADI